MLFILQFHVSKEPEKLLPKDANRNIFRGFDFGELGIEVGYNYFKAL